MIKKTMTITSLAILVAAISVATTMTFVQADVTGDTVDIRVSPNATPDSNLTAIVNGYAEYEGIIGGPFVNAELNFTDIDDGGFDGIINDTKSELTLEVPGTNVVGGVFGFTGGVPGVVTFTDGNLDRSVQFGELAVTTNGTAVDSPQVAVLVAEIKTISVDIDGAGETVWILLPEGVTTLDEIVVEIDDVDWVGMSGTIGFFECGTNMGATSVALFDRNTLQITITPGALDAPIAIHCDYEGFHGEITKALIGDCDTDGLQVRNDTAQECTFRITYMGDNATITDTISAGWNATTVAFSPNGGTGGGDCTVDITTVEGTGKGKNKKGNMKSATGFTCDDIGEDAIFDVTIDTRESTGKGHGKRGDTVFKPTECGTFDINSGAIAFLTNVTDGTIAIGSLDGLPLVLNSTDPLTVDVGDSESTISCGEA